MSPRSPSTFASAGDDSVTTELLAHLRTKLEARKLLVPYVMAGQPDRASFPDALVAVAKDADAVEVGLPFSDPLMDGPVIAAAGERSIRAGVGPLDALEMLPETPCPKVVMTYYNPIHRLGEAEFCARAAAAGVSGLIVPDLPLEESSSLRSAAAGRGLAWVPLVAPTSSPERVTRIAETATGFVYAVSTMGVTGTRDALSASAAGVVGACRMATDLPVLVGIGVSNSSQAVEAATEADGVVIGSAVVRRLLEEGASSAQAFLHDVRDALDSAFGARKAG
ncbi:MAG: tryptophan synthase alpha chain [Actinomycetota bacterium]|jgi:tryptophan synthase alpha chain|nr:tryptophan synthase alpha chain [Actinomycetota bacterium]